MFSFALFCLVSVATGNETWEDHAVPPVGGATTLTLKEGSIQVMDGDGKMHDYKRFVIEGSGPHWKVIDGVGSIWVKKGTTQFKMLYKNELSEETTIHQHGFTPDINKDGVPYLSQVPIFPNRENLYTFDLYPQNIGTYFVHSHYGFHHTKGLGAPLIVDGDMPNGYPEAEVINSAENVLLWLEDFCSYPAGEDQQKYNPTCSVPMATFTKLQKDWNDEAKEFKYEECSKAGTDGDVAFTYQLANGHTLADPVVHYAQAGQRLRLRVINQATMSNYKLQFDSAFGDTTVIATDGQPIKPISSGATEGWWIAVAQRLDIMLTVPDSAGAFPILARTDGATPHTQSGIVIVVGGGKHAPKPNTFEMVTKDGVGFMATPESACQNDGECLPGQTQKSNGIVQELRMEAWFPLAQSHGPAAEFTVNVTGDNGFNSMNARSYQLPPMGPLPFQSNKKPFKVKQGQRVCVKVINKNADDHAMHLHGHSYQVTEIMGQKVTGAIRDTLLIPKGGCREVKICFNAENPGAWPFHCHMAFHLAAGMFTTVEYITGEQVDTAPPAAASLDSTTPLKAGTESDSSTRLLYIAVATMAMIIIFLTIALVQQRIQNRKMCNSARERLETELSNLSADRA